MKKLSLIFLYGLVLLIQGCSKDDVASVEDQLIYETDFSNNDGSFWVGTEGKITIGIQDGSYYFLNNNTSGSFYVTLNALFANVQKEGALESSIQIKNTGGSNPGAGGIIFNRNRKNPSQVRFILNGLGMFKVDATSEGKDPELYQDWIEHPAIKKNQSNVFRVELRKDNYYFYINGKEVFTMGAKGAKNLDEVGYSVGYKTILQADYFKVTSLK